MAVWITLLAATVLVQSPTVPREQRHNWRNVEIVGGGFVTGIEFHPHQKDLVYARTDIGGAYRWEAKAKRWIPLQDWLTRADWNAYGTESIGLDPSDPRKLYLAVGTYTNDWAGNGAILRSDDQGRTFKRFDLPFKNGGNMDGRSIGERLAVDPNKGSLLYFGTRHNGLWRSEDAGATWSQDKRFPFAGTPEGYGVGLVAFDRYSGASGRGSQTIYAGIARAQESLWRTTDGGATWSPIPGQPSGFIPHHMTLAPDGTIYVTYANGSGPNGVTDGAVWKYAPKTSAWTNITPIKPSAEDRFGYAGLSVDLRHPQTLVVSSLDRWTKGDDIWRSVDGGATWKSLKAHAVRDSKAAPFLNWDHEKADLGHWIGDVEIDPFRPGRALYVTGATIWGTDDLTQLDADKDTHWDVRAGGLEETAVIDLLSPMFGPRLVSALGDIGGFRHDDFNVSPASGIRKNPVLSNTDSIDYASNRPDFYVRVGRGGGPSGGFSRDGGTTWSPFLTIPPGAQGGSVALSSDGQAVVWIPERSVPLVTRDWGATWRKVENVPAGGRVVADRVRSGEFYILSGTTLFTSNDYGANFAARASSLPAEHGRLVASFTQPGRLWLPTKRGLYRSRDGGATFEKLAGIEWADHVGLGKAAPGKSEPAIFLIGMIAGINDAFRSDDGGEKWVRITDADHRFGTMNNITGDPRQYGRVYLGTNGRGILYGDPR